MNRPSCFRPPNCSQDIIEKLNKRLVPIIFPLSSAISTPLNLKELQLLKVAPPVERKIAASLKRFVTAATLVGLLFVGGCNSGGGNNAGGGPSQITGIYFLGPNSVVAGSSIQLTVAAQTPAGNDSDKNDFSGTLSVSYSDSNPSAASYATVSSPNFFMVSVNGILPNQSTIITATLKVNGSTTFTAQTTISITSSAAALAVQSLVLTNGEIGMAYMPQTLQATGGVSPYTWSDGGSLPPGMSLSASGVISGTPTTAGVFGFEVRVQDSAGTNAIAGETITVISQPVVSVTNVTVHNGSSDPQLATITTSDGSQIDLWGDKDANGNTTAVRTMQVKTGGATSVFTLDSSGNLIRFQGTNGTVFNLSWQGNVGTEVAYSADGNSMVGPFQVTLPTTAAAVKALALRRRSSIQAAASDSAPQNDFQVQVSHCGKPAQNAAVSLTLSSSLQSSAPLTSIYGEQSAPGTYDALIPVLIPSSVQAPAVSFCESVANAFQPVANAFNFLSTGENVVKLSCAAVVTAGVVSTDLLLAPIEAAVYADCVSALSATTVLSAVLNGASLAGVLQPSPLSSYCASGVPAVANLINDLTVWLQVTVTLPGLTPLTDAVTSTPYGGQGPFPGSGLAPEIINFDTGGACDIIGSWTGGFSTGDGNGALGATITNFIATPGTYNVALTVTDEDGPANYIFPGTPTSETEIGTSFNFGPATIDGVIGTAQGFLIPTGNAMGGTFAGQANNASGGWNMIKQ